MKKIICVIIAAVMVFSASMTAFAASGWNKDETGWWYQNEDGGYISGEWLQDAGEWYYFGDNGYMQTGWILWEDNWYYLDESGAMVTGWLFMDGIWYYLDETGAMASGWKEISGKWYFFDECGRLFTSTYIDQKYFVDENGEWDGVTLDEIPDTDDIGIDDPIEDDPDDDNKIVFTFHQNSTYTNAQLRIEVRRYKDGSSNEFVTDTISYNWTTTLTINTDEYEIIKISCYKWFYEWVEVASYYWDYTHNATTFTLIDNGGERQALIW